MTDALANPILNTPYEAPSRHFAMGPKGPTGEIAEFRRPSESFIPIPQSKKGSTRSADAVSVPLEFDFDVTHERREKNEFINHLRDEVERWRRLGYPRVTPISRKLLLHWSDATRENRILFAQREAAETAIFLAEVAGRRDFVPSRTTSADWLRQIEVHNIEHNAGLPRVALKMATGAGKTIVMAMLIAWHTLNKVTSPHDTRFVKRFLVVAPGITIRDRLKVLQPADPENYYDERGVVPADLRGQLGQAQIVITNYHAFLPRDAKEIRGVAVNTRKLLLNGKADPFKETPQTIVSRVLRGLGSGKGDVVVFNDEAHHCYQARTADSAVEKLGKEEQEANEDARVWFRGLLAVKKHLGIKAAYDLSATPYYLKGSGYAEGHIFPWVVSDFSLMDAIESGIVKVPRLPVDDDADGKQVTYLNLWEQVGQFLPKRVTSSVENWVMPDVLEGALRSLYASYERSFDDWERRLKSQGEPPPVMIVVCPNTLVSKLIYDWISGKDHEAGGGTIHAPGHLALFSNVVDGQTLARPFTIVVDSRQLESGEAMKGDFKEAAATEIEAFKAQYRRDNPGGDSEKLTDEDLLREVMNTVGKKGKLGEQIRCVVSVAMLTEGWDANTVTHILGIRAFGSQLLCEQVVGRGLRRRSYAANDEGMFEPEYSNIYGIPFAFIPSDREVGPGPEIRPAIRVEALSQREHLRIEFPALDGYRVELPDTPLIFEPAFGDRMIIGPSIVPRWTEASGIVGEGERIESVSDVRPQELAFQLAARMLQSFFSNGEDRQPWRFPQLVSIARQWLDHCVDVEPGYNLGVLTLAEAQHQAAETIYNAISRLDSDDARRPSLRPMLRRFDPVGSTDDVSFVTRKKTVETYFSHVSHVTLDGKDGNTWEEKVAGVCEQLADEGLITSYVKNDQLGFTIPYVHKGSTHSYIPDFLLRVARQKDESFDRMLIVEVSGSQKSPGPTKEKARTARDSWCTAVNNHAGFGRWGYLELHDMQNVSFRLREAISELIDNGAIIGDPDQLDLLEAPRGA